jgi:hypothetical protein
MATPSYIERCIESLPANKQAAARQAFADLLEGREDDGVLTRLLLVFEATSAYASTIPSDLSLVGDRQLRQLDERFAQMANMATAADETRLAQLRGLLQAQLPAMAKELSADKLAGKVEALRVSIDHLERTSRRQRRVRLAVILAFMAVAFAAGSGAVLGWYYTDYVAGQAAQRKFAVLRSYGVDLQLTDAGGQMLKVSLNSHGPVYDRGWFVDDSKRCYGAELIVPPPQQ